MTLYDIPAPAKVNLFLHVVGRRADGYHLLQTVFRFVDLQDTLHIEARGDGRIVRATDLPGVPEKDDLTVRAALALQRATGVRAGASIAIEKRIPQGGGLGGGSSDAASVLIALNRLWNTGLHRAQLMRLALPLGADVPVFVFGQSAFAEGVGERLTAVALPERAYLLAMPPTSVPTASVFAATDLTRDTKPVTIADFSEVLDSRFGRNDLESVVFARHPVVRQASQALARCGVASRMSGSGACLFAEFPSMDEATLAQREIAVKMRVADPDAHRREDSPGSCIAWTWACQGLSEHPLRNWIAS